MKKITEIREATGLNMKKFAEMYGIPYRTLQNWEAGVTQAPEYVISLIENDVHCKARAAVGKTVEEAREEYVETYVSDYPLTNELKRFSPQQIVGMLGYWNENEKVRKRHMNFTEFVQACKVGYPTHQNAVVVYEYKQVTHTIDHGMYELYEHEQEAVWYALGRADLIQ